MKVRLPGDVSPASVLARKNDQQISLANVQGYLTLDRLAPGEQLQIRFDRPERAERVTIGNPGFKSYSFDVRWRGATVVRIDPAAGNPSRGFNRIIKGETSLYMSGAVEHPLYQRANWKG